VHDGPGATTFPYRERPETKLATRPPPLLHLDAYLCFLHQKLGARIAKPSKPCNARGTGTWFQRNRDDD
jgi:hypothetical protein